VLIYYLHQGGYSATLPPWGSPQKKKHARNHQPFCFFCGKKQQIKFLCVFFEILKRFSTVVKMVCSSFANISTILLTLFILNKTIKGWFIPGASVVTIFKILYFSLIQAKDIYLITIHLIFLHPFLFF
jgi:hypothetical protein